MHTVSLNFWYQYICFLSRLETRAIIHLTEGFTQQLLIRNSYSQWYVCSSTVSDQMPIMWWLMVLNKLTDQMLSFYIFSTKKAAHMVWTRKRLPPLIIRRILCGHQLNYQIGGWELPPCVQKSPIAVATIGPLPFLLLQLPLTLLWRSFQVLRSSGGGSTAFHIHVIHRNPW